MSFTRIRIRPLKKTLVGSHPRKRNGPGFYLIFTYKIHLLLFSFDIKVYYWYINTGSSLWSINTSRKVNFRWISTWKDRLRMRIRAHLKNRIWIRSKHEFILKFHSWAKNIILLKWYKILGNWAISLGCNISEIIRTS